MYYLYTFRAENMSKEIFFCIIHSQAFTHSLRKDSLYIYCILSSELLEKRR